jgi:hypothetical protein
MKLLSLPNPKVKCECCGEEVQIPTIQEQIVEIMANFDFKKVRKVMELLNWRWTDVGVPEVLHLRKAARKLMGDIQDDTIRLESGGFCVDVDRSPFGDSIRLSFQISDWEGFSH